MADTTPIYVYSSLVLLAGILAYKIIIEPIFLNPLRHIPSAHWSIPIFGDTWILYQRWRGRNNATTYNAHVKHGSVVRMGRLELSVNCVENGIRTIYGGGWEKHAWYPNQFASYGVRNMFSTMGHSPHSQKKRTMANIYSKSYIASSPQVAANSKALISTRSLPLLQSISDSGTAVDVHDMNNAFTMDFMSAYQFGLGQSTNFTQQVETRNKIMHDYHSRRIYEVYHSEMPWLVEWCNKIGFPLIPKAMNEANRLLENWNSQMCKAAEDYISNPARGVDDFAGDEPIVYKQFKIGMSKLRTKDRSAGKELDPKLTPKLTSYQDPYASSEIHSEMLDHLGAGHETSAIALTYLYYEMSKNPELQHELRKELLTLEPKIVWPLPSTADINDFNLPDPKQLDNLPFLNATVMETLRLHTPIPGIEPRVSPHVPGGNKLGDYSNIPGGVRVSSMPYTLHRNPDVFTDPFSFDPPRWIQTEKNEEQLKEMHRWFWAFGSGGRMCIGSHLAVQNIKLLVAAIYTNYITEIFDDDGIEELDAYTTRPKSNHLYLKFRHV